MGLRKPCEAAYVHSEGLHGAAFQRVTTLTYPRRFVSVRSDCPALVMEWVIVSTIDSGHLEGCDGWEEGFEEAGLVG